MHEYWQRPKSITTRAFLDLGLANPEHPFFSRARSDRLVVPFWLGAPATPTCRNGKRQAFFDARALLLKLWLRLAHT
jgi:hypothetical protein